MRANFSTSWIFQGWIIYFTILIVVLCAQKAISKSLHCQKTQYLKASNCCDMCGPGYRLLSECSDSKDTICTRCGRGEYQPTWTTERRCLQQKFCDPGKGFIQDRPDNPLGEEPCRCNAGLQCSPINCEFCERIKSCRPGEGLESDPDSTSGRKICVACKKGFFSQDTSREPCRQWTNCKTQGRSETQPGSLHTDAVCGPPVTGAPTSWVVVSVLSVITVLSLLILLLFCYKDKLKLLSVNLRSCVQNLKRTRIQQETLAPLYHSGGGGAGPGASNCTLCETTKLICQAPHLPTTETPHPFSTSALDVKVSLPPTPLLTGDEKGPKGKKEAEEADSEGSGEPEEVSEEEEDGGGGGSHLWAGSCACVVPVREPLEVGENEDCSQAVCPGTLGPCSCGGADAEERAEGGNEDGGKTGSPKTSETGGQSLFSLVAPPVASPSRPPTDLCVPLSQARPEEARLHLTDRAQGKGEELYRLTSVDSASTPETTTPTVASFNPLLTSSSVGELYLDKTPEASEDERDQGLSWRDSEGNKLLSSGFLELECAPESLQSQLAEPALTSGQVTGNHNTTFISSGQVMNFSGDVIVVYVSQTSLGNEGAGPGDAFGSPVQEQANETALFFQSGPATANGEPVNHDLPQDGPLPVQEVMDEWRRK